MLYIFQERDTFFSKMGQRLATLKTDFLDKKTPLWPNKGGGKVDIDIELKNPGTYEDLNKQLKEMQGHTHDGIKFKYNVPHDPQFTTMHTLQIANNMPIGYRFGAGYNGLSKFGFKSFPLIFGDIDVKGNVNANFISQLNDRWMLKVMAERVQRQIAGKAVLEYIGDNYSACVSTTNPSWEKQSGEFAFNLLQAVTPHLALGTELLIQCGPQIWNRYECVLGIGGRYTDGDAIWAATATAKKLMLSYVMKCSEDLQIGAEFLWKAGIFGQHSVISTWFYQAKLASADCVFRGSIDSNFVVTGSVVKHIKPWDVNVSARLDQVKKDLKLGIEITMGLA